MSVADVDTTIRYQPTQTAFVAHPARAGGMARPDQWCYETGMATFLGTFLLPIALCAVALVLLLGLVNMMRGGSANRSQQLMRWRVVLQFVAIVITMFAVWALGR